MRLCLDEHYSFEIAEQLRTKGNDACSVKERPDLLGLNDAELWGRLVGEQRGLVTENVADFVVLGRRAAEMGQRHYGLIFSSDRSMPRSRHTIGLFVERLEVILQEHDADDAFVDRFHWLHSE